MNFALGIEVEILFVRNEQKDCNVKPDPQGNAQKPLNIFNKKFRQKITPYLQNEVTLL